MKRFFISVLLIGVAITLYTMDQEHKPKKQKVADSQEGLKLLMLFSNDGALNKYHEESLNEIKKSLENVEYVYDDKKGICIYWQPTGISVNKQLEESYFIAD